MAITTVKSWIVGCDHCSKTIDVFAGKTWSHWLGEPIFNRGQLTTHLRRERWTVGTQVLCPDCAVTT
jgi:hypothetical protein